VVRWRMLVSSLSGLGAAFVEGTDFKCNASQCYAIGAERQKIFEAYQTLLNRFAQKLGFTPLVVDGFIGSGTVAATRKVAAAVIASGLDLNWVKTLAGSGSTKAQVAARISDFTVVVQGLAQATLPVAPMKRGFTPPPNFFARLFPATPTPGRTPPGKTPGTAPSGGAASSAADGLDLIDPNAGAAAVAPSILALSPTGKKVLVAVGLGAVALFLWDRRAKRAPGSAAG